MGLVVTEQNCFVLFLDDIGLRNTLEWMSDMGEHEQKCWNPGPSLKFDGSTRGGYILSGFLGPGDK